jgi:valyl-tRNA synthetase
MSEQTMAKAYTPAEVEAARYAEWEARGYFHATAASAKKPFTIVIPPPNVTGVLTLGHVLNNTLQDILIRWEKMRGREVCWVPGTDHAGIATQAKVEKFLKESENLTRGDLGRERFLERVWQWRQTYGGKIIQQLRTIGTACDWQRERFTLDPALSRAVEEVFVRLYEKGLVYRGHRMINWCPKSRTAISDEEVIYKEHQGKLWHFKYPYKDGTGFVTVATTRPETMLGDTAVAVHPDDPRYRDRIGQTIVLPLVNRDIPLVADSFVDPKFGTGAVKVTPAHDPNDYECARRHNLPMLNIMNDDGTMNERAGAEFNGMDRYACRKAVVAQLESLGLVAAIEPYVHPVGYSERGDVPVEPRLSEQWFVRMQPLAQPAIAAVRDGRIRFHPQRWVKTYMHWMENIKDWCISRQLWWGHRIPAYYCQACGETVVARAMPTSCPKCRGSSFRQDEDVLDTWFSSWLWPFSVFGWPEPTADLQRFYPTNTLVTAPDIIFFWVARMIMAGLEFVGEVPFSDVYFTSIIRDDSGRKMSKSLNNSPDPLDVVSTYGADALRFTIIYIAPVGQDIRYSNEKCEIGRNFANKLWNAVRFRLRQGPLSPDWDSLRGLDAADLRPDDRWILARLNATVRAATHALEKFRFNDLTRVLYEFMWNDFCDWYLESAKAVFNGPDQASRQRTLRVFDHALGAFLRLLHPVMPFVTDELYHQMGYVGPEDSIMVAPWPRPFDARVARRLGATEETVRRVTSRCELIRSVRNVRAKYLIPDGRRIDVVIAPVDAAAADFLHEDPVSLQSLLYASAIEIRPGYQPTGPCGVAVSDLGTAYVPLADVIDLEAERARLRKQLDETTGFVAGVQKKLSNENFVQRAPPDVVARERTRLTELEDRLARIREQLAALS